VKTCVSCKYYKPIFCSEPLCNHPLAEIHPITGGKAPCRIERAWLFGGCGASARRHEAAETKVHE
jgi:hypothetical protein